MGKYVPMNLIFGDVLTPERSATFETQVDLARGRERQLGGEADIGVKSTDYVDVPGARVVRLAIETPARVHAMGLVSAGTGYFRLWSITLAAAVPDSEESFTDTSGTLQEGGDLLLAAGDYKLQVKGSSASYHVIVWGAALVTQ